MDKREETHIQRVREGHSWQIESATFHGGTNVVSAKSRKKPIETRAESVDRREGEVRIVRSMRASFLRVHGMI